MGITAELRHRLLHLVLPALCLGCGRAEPGPRLALGLCLACRGRLRPLRGPACQGCGEPLAVRTAPPGYLCGACRARPPAYDRLLAGWGYEPPLDRVIAGLKFGRLDYLGAHLATALAERLGGRLRGLDGVVPVPLHWRRRLGRGYDQAAAIARPLAGRLGLPLVAALRRRRPTRPQAGLERGRRRRNLRRAFAPRHPAPGRLLLVDDVVTTTSTLDAAARALRRGGAREIVALAAARTPSHAGDGFDPTRARFGGWR